MTNEPVHLAIDTGPLHGHRTGVGIAAEGIVEALRRRDDVELLPYVVSARATTGNHERRLPIPGIVASHLWSRGDHPRADRWLGGARVLHGTNYVAPPTALPTVVSVYDCWFLRHPESATPVVRRAGRTLRRAIGRGAWVHASSHTTADAVRELLGTERVRTIGLGAPTPSPAPDDAVRPPVATMLGRRPFVAAVATEERRKGLPLLVDSFARLAGDDPDLALVLAGTTGDDSAAVVAAIETAAPDVRARIHRLGPVDPATKEWLLRHAAALAYPSIDEGFGFPVLEAQLAGTPVVAMRVGSIPEIAGDAARLVDVRDATDFAAALDEVLTNGTLRLGMIEAGYRNVNRFTWTVTADELLALYRLAIEVGR